MSSASKPQLSYDQSQVAAVRKAWIDAVLGEDVSRLAELMTDDVVVIRGNGQVVTGKSEIKQEMLQAFKRYDIEGTVASSEIVVRENWAVAIDEVASSRTPVGSIEGALKTHYKAVFVFSRFDGPWKVARAMELIG
ncbi:MAG TPA: SgcJ/EcaC family oxidoreductase [Terriglobales bacterium]|nr:SgcJ/EcaC family oxidoreductase [Terriglobales bacterium]